MLRFYFNPKFEFLAISLIYNFDFVLGPGIMEGGMGVYWIHPDVSPSICPSFCL